MNIINAAFVRNGVTVRTLPVYQYNRGMILNISGLDDLPSTFRVDFANTEIGQSKSVIGTDNAVHVPYEYFVPGATIHCWLVWTGEDYTVTRKHIMIPVARRATPTDEEPTPDEQGVIDQAIAALNSGVETVQEIADGIPEQIDTALAEAKASGEFDGADGVSPTVTVTPIIGGHQVMITDAEGEHTFDVTDGEDGLDGDPGFSPIATVTQTQTGAVISVTDKTGTTTATVTNGAKGDPGNPGTPGTDGFSPVATVTQTQTGATVTITDKAGTTTAQISNGAKGDPGDDYVLTAQDKAEIAQQAAAEVDVPVQDVQVNGTSILNAQGVANVPEASESDFGVVSIGNGLQKSPSSNKMMSFPATSTDIKNGSEVFKQITPLRQHESAFYGLARAAGVNMGSSSNPVGTYTDEAKVAIQKMFGIYEAPWELIREDTFTNETEADYVITTDVNGEPLELTDAVMWFETPKQDTYAKKGQYGQIWFYINGSDMRIAPEPGGWEQQANASAHGFVILADQRGGFMRIAATAQAAYTNSGAVRYRYMALSSKSTEQQSGLFLVRDIVDTDICWFTKIVIKLVTGTGHYKLYGKRKWQ